MEHVRSKGLATGRHWKLTQAGRVPCFIYSSGLDLLLTVVIDTGGSFGVCQGLCCVPVVSTAWGIGGNTPFTEEEAEARGSLACLSPQLTGGRTSLWMQVFLTLKPMLPTYLLNIPIGVNFLRWNCWVSLK